MYRCIIACSAGGCRGGKTLSLEVLLVAAAVTAPARSVGMCDADAGSPSACFCSGLTATSVPDRPAEFRTLCRVPDTKFGHVTAAFLFDLRQQASTHEAVAAFHRLCAQGGLEPESSKLFDSAVAHRPAGATYKDYGDVVLNDRP